MGLSPIEDPRVLRRALHAIPYPLFIHDGESVLYANPAAIDFLCAEHASQVIGRSPAKFVHPDCQHAMEERLEAMLASGTSTSFVEKLVRVDGETIHAQITGYVLSDDGDNPLVMVIGRKLEL